MLFWTPPIVRILWAGTLMLLGVSLSACGTLTPVILPAAATDCAEMIPDSWRVPVPGAPLPASTAGGEWISFGDAQTGQLDKANGRTLDTISIVEKCEGRKAELSRYLNRPWYRRLTGL